MPTKPDIPRTLLVRITRSDMSPERYAHACAYHRAERSDSGSDSLYRHEHPAAHFALSSQAGGNSTHEGAVCWCAWRIGFEPDTGAGNVICAERAYAEARACLPIARKIHAIMGTQGANWERSPALVILAAATALRVSSITIAPPFPERSARYSINGPIALAEAANALRDAIDSAEEWVTPGLRKRAA